MTTKTIAQKVLRTNPSKPNLQVIQNK